MKLLSLFATIVVAGAITIVSVGIFRSCSTQDTAELKTEAIKTVKELGFEPIGASCMNQDSDADDYISCTVTVIDENKKRSLMAIECAATKFTFKSGCRLQKGVLQNSL